eukprot:m.336929 g.336929  ORF g.336929 m.336929 type:complete len:1372 (+) comp17999_c0_seq1:254-4369(+)
MDPSHFAMDTSEDEDGRKEVVVFDSDFKNVDAHLPEKEIVVFDSDANSFANDKINVDEDEGVPVNGSRKGNQGRPRMESDATSSDAPSPKMVPRHGSNMSRRASLDMADSGISSNEHVDSDGARTESPMEGRAHRLLSIRRRLGSSLPNLYVDTSSDFLGASPSPSQPQRPARGESTDETPKRRSKRIKRARRKSIHFGASRVHDSPSGTLSPSMSPHSPAFTRKANRSPGPGRKFNLFPTIPTKDDLKILEDVTESAFKKNSKPERSRSLSPPLRHIEGENEIWSSTVMNQRFGVVQKEMLEKLEHFLEDINQDNEIGDLKVENTRLLQIVEALLDHAKHGSLSGAMFEDCTTALARLLEQNIDDESSIRIRALLLIIAPVARLLECLEFDPTSVRLSDEQGQISKRLENMIGENSNLPRYISDKLTSTLGPRRHSDASVANSEESSSTYYRIPIVKFLEFGKPRKRDFHFESLLSSGAYGSVYVAKHKKTQELVAIKHLRKKDMLTKNCTEQVLREKEVMKFGHNPFIASLFCTFSSQNSLFLVMEYAPGGDLATLLKNLGRLSERAARRYFAEAVLAVEYIHEFAIVHRDLKPDNLVITHGGHIKLIDFGLSKFGVIARTSVMIDGERKEKDSSTSSGRGVVGTPSYIAPEVILGKGFGPPVDWWAMGVILYEFVTGKYPFEGDTAEEIFSKAVNCPYTPVEQQVDDEEFTGELLDLIQRLLQKSPELRLGTNSLYDATISDLGEEDIKDHLWFENVYFNNEGEEDIIDWDGLIEEKATFIPELDHELDTSYFDSREDRYEPSVIGDSDDDDKDDKDGKETVETPEGPKLGMFKNFSCVNLFASSRPPSPSTSDAKAHLERYSSNKSPLRPVDRAKSLAAKKRTESEPTPRSVSSLVPASVREGHSSQERGRERYRKDRAGTTTHSFKAESQSTSSTSSSTEDLLQHRPQQGARTPSLLTPTGSHRTRPQVPSPLRQKEESTSPPDVFRCPLGCKECMDVTIVWDDDVGFGFSYQTELMKMKTNVHRISSVRKRSAAARAGMRVNQLIIQVNGIDTSTQNRRKLDRMILSNKNQPVTFHCAKGGFKHRDPSGVNAGVFTRLTRTLSGKKRRKNSKKEKSDASANESSRGSIFPETLTRWVWSYGGGDVSPQREDSPGGSPTGGSPTTVSPGASPMAASPTRRQTGSWGSIFSRRPSNKPQKSSNLSSSYGVNDQLGKPQRLVFGFSGHKAPNTSPADNSELASSLERLSVAPPPSPMIKTEDVDIDDESAQTDDQRRGSVFSFSDSSDNGSLFGFGPGSSLGSPATSPLITRKAGDGVMIHAFSDDSVISERGEQPKTRDDDHDCKEDNNQGSEESAEEEGFDGIFDC